MSAENSVARHAEIRRIQNRRGRFPPRDGVIEEAGVLTQQAGAIFVNGRTGTFYYYQKEVARFRNAYGEAFLGFSEVETPSVVPALTALPLPVNISA